jgi:hypothetical protein
MERSSPTNNKPDIPLLLVYRQLPDTALLSKGTLVNLFWQGQHIFWFVYFLQIKLHSAILFLFIISLEKISEMTIFQRISVGVNFNNSLFLGLTKQHSFIAVEDG